MTSTTKRAAAERTSARVPGPPRSRGRQRPAGQSRAAAQRAASERAVSARPDGGGPADALASVDASQPGASSQLADQPQAAAQGAAAQGAAAQGAAAQGAAAQGAAAQARAEVGERTAARERPGADEPAARPRSAAQPWLLEDKLQIPQPSLALLRRRRLTDLLEQAAQHRVTVVSGPAGAGKTIACASWATADARHPPGRLADAGRRGWRPRPVLAICRGRAGAHPDRAGRCAAVGGGCAARGVPAAAWLRPPSC